MLSDRRQIVLRALIEEYIARALPVGSRTLVERYNLGYSSATIRNDLSALEEEGYLRQPHTSAGRIPTDSGYRVFVDDLLANFDQQQIDKSVVARMRESARELDDLMARTNRALAQLTDCLSVVVPPRMVSAEIKLVQLIRLGDTRILMVIVTEQGKVFDRQVTYHRSITDAELEGLTNEMNTLFAGVSLPAKGYTVPELAKRCDELTLKFVSELFTTLEASALPKPVSLGAAKLMEQPEFSESATLMPLLAELEDDTVLLNVYDEAVRSEGPLVRIGHENYSDALSGISLVASRFGTEENMGVVAILGPTRMDYSQVLRAVQLAKNVLQSDDSE